MNVDFNVSKDELLSIVPKNMRSNITDKFVQDLNLSISDPYHRKSVKDNIVGFMSVFHQGKYKITDYINAVKFVTFQLAGFDNIDCYRMTFPDRWQKFMQEGTPKTSIHAYVGSYNKNKLVVQIREQAMVPVWLQHADTFNEAVKVQADLMKNAQSEKVRSDAANSIMTHLKRIEPKQAALDININNQQENDVLADLRAATEALREQTKSAMNQGITIDQIAEAEIIKPREDE